MKKYLIAIDSDGTLKDDNGCISRRTKVILNKVKKNNVVVLCTGRPRYHARDINSKLKLSDYIISSNGAEIYDEKNKEVIYAKYINKSILKRIYDDSRKENIRLVFVVGNKEYASDYIVNNSQILIDKSNIKDIIKLNVKQIIFIGNDNNKMNRFKQFIANKYDLAITDSAYKKSYTWICVNNKRCNKGRAIEYLSKYLKIRRNYTIAIGNDNNDISMIKYVRTGVAVRNGSKELINEANYITEANNNDGVYMFLKKWREENEKEII